MKRIFQHTTLIISLIFANSLSVSALEPASPPDYPSPVIITEVQTGASTASDEFVELYNVSGAPVDITGWQVRYLNASSSASDTTLLATIAADNEQPVILAASEYYVLHTSSVDLPLTARGQLYSPKLSSADKAVGLFAPDLQTCKQLVIDALAWGSSAFGEGTAAVQVSGSGDRLAGRYVDANGYYADTNHNNQDGWLKLATKNTANPGVSQGASPGAANTLSSLDSPSSLVGEGSLMPPVSISGCTPPLDTDDPDNGLEPPTEEPPSFEEGSPSSPPQTDGPIIPIADRGLRAPQITEILPNPGKPLTDANDEFIELYNSNDRQFDLSGFKLVSGNGKRRFTFPQGTMLAPRSFKAYFSADTHFSLANTQGQVALLDPLGTVIDSSEAYTNAKENQAWALAKGAWHWTARPTPNAANILVAPAVKSSNKKSSKTKTGAVAFTKAGQVNAVNPGSSTPMTEVPKNQLHTGVLALVGGFALLYGAYEYRSDLANKFQQFRIYRAARREARQSSKGR